MRILADLWEMDGDSWTKEDLCQDAKGFVFDMLYTRASMTRDKELGDLAKEEHDRVEKLVREG